MGRAALAQVSTLFHRKFESRKGACTKSGRGAKQLGEVKRDFLRARAIIRQARHVANLAPPSAKEPVPLRSIVIIRVRIEAATAGHRGIHPTANYVKINFLV
jgi:hypothetical protein